MVNIPLFTKDYIRGVAKEAGLRTRNRYFEQNPVLNAETGAALIARPGMRKFMDVGDGPIRAIYNSPGAFDDALFVVSANSLFRVDPDETLTEIGPGIFASSHRSFVSMAATAPIGTIPEYLFIADGATLWVYIENGYAFGILTASGTISNSEQVRIGDVYYQFTTGSVDAGTPAGTAANPWLVAIAGTTAATLQNLFDAINASGVAGTAYSTALVEHPAAEAFVLTSTTVSVRAKAPGIAGNGIVSTETGANLSWGAATFTGGGDPQVRQVPTPDDVGIITVVHLDSYVVCVPAQGNDINGRFYWIEPGEITINDLNFATAESAPDPLLGAVVFGDQLWLPGSSTTEVWYATGDATAPFTRLQGVAFNRGTWEGTALQVKESMVIVDNDGAVFQIGGGLKRISTPDIEERIRVAMAVQANDPLN